MVDEPETLMLYKLASHSRLVITLCGSLALGGCAGSNIRTTELAPSSAIQNALRFDNQGRDRLDVYLVGETRSWRIGRLEPGQARWLTLPADVPVADLSRLQLTVVANATMSVDPRLDPRAISTLKQP
ncbi:MAG: hypothetical protein ABIT38_22235, partial [Gemmatimonadaceae bacterium]